MEVITGTVAAASVTAGTPATSGGATLSAAVAAKQADAIRRLASAFIKSTQMKIVGDSEIVDEFASPIYAGLAAVPVGPTSPNPGSTTSKDGGSMQDLVAMRTSKTHGMPEPGGQITQGMNGTNADASVVGEVPQNGAAQASQPMPSSGAIKNAPALPIDKLEVQKLVEQQYDAPTIKDQLEAGDDKIVVERTLLDEKVVVNGDKRTAMCLIEERVVDRKYLEHGNLTDLILEVRHGHVPTIRQLYLAIIDLTDLATFKVFRPLLARVKIDPAKYRLRQLSADLERKSLAPTLGREEESLVKQDRKVEERSWFKTDHVVEKIGHTDVETKKEVEIVTMNVTDLCTVEMSRGSIEGFLTRHSDLNNSFADCNEIARIENALPPEAFAEINRSAMAWVRENLCSTTLEYTTEETFNRYKVDLDGFLGKKIEMSDKQATERVQTTLTEYLSPSDKISLENIDTYQQALERFALTQKTMELKYDPEIVNTYVVPSEGVTFDDGWITYIPGGSIANLGIKADLEAKITGMDVFWAAVDVATIALAVVTWGSSTAITGAGKAAVVGGAKVFAKGAAKAAAKASAKAAAKASAKAAAKTAAKASAKTAAKQAGRLTIGNAGKGVRAGAKKGVQQSGKVKIKVKNPGTAGAKAAPSSEVQTVTTYKNIPRNNGEWTGTPGDSTWKPDPKVKPANTKANPNGKTNAQILKENNVKDGVEFKNGCPDFSSSAKGQVKVSKMTTNRAKNFAQADSQLAAKVRSGKADSSIVQMLERNGVDPKNATKGDIARLRAKEGLTWHEHQDMQTMQLIPKELHGTIPHKGGISALKQEEKLSAQSAASTASESISSAAKAPASTTNS